MPEKTAADFNRPRAYRMITLNRSSHPVSRIKKREFKRFAMRFILVFWLSLGLSLLCGCAATSKQDVMGSSGLGNEASSGPERRVNVFGLSNMGDTERERWCHDYSQYLGC
jgi:hypothetical protein